MICNNASFNETALKKFNQNFKLLKEEMNTAINRVLSFGPNLKVVGSKSFIKQIRNRLEMQRGCEQ